MRALKLNKSENIFLVKSHEILKSIIQTLLEKVFTSTNNTLIKYIIFWFENRKLIKLE